MNEVEYTERLYREPYQGYDELKEADTMLCSATLRADSNLHAKGSEVPKSAVSLRLPCFLVLPIVACRRIPALKEAICRGASVCCR